MDNENNKSSQNMFAGFWVRLASDIVDMILLLLFGYFISTPLRPLLYSVGETGAWVGVIVTAAYFTIFHSGIGKGQSIAKRLFNIQVVNTDGSSLNSFKSFLRYAAMACILNNGGVMQSIMLGAPVLQTNSFKYIYTTLTSIWIVGVILFVVLHPLKQGLHDLLASSIVIKTGTFDIDQVTQRRNPQLTKRVFWAWGICCAVIIALVITFHMLKKDTSTMSETSHHTDLEKNIEQDTAFQHVICQSFIDHENKMGPALIIAGFIPHIQFEDEENRMDIIKNAVDISLNSSLDLSGMQYIVVFVRSGFNIGISFQFDQHIEGFTAQGEWIENFVELQIEADNEASKTNSDTPVPALSDNN